MLRKWLCQADVKIILEPIDPILIKSGYATMDGPDMVPVSTFRNGKSTYYFPGTSLKGVLRSHMERIARTLYPGSVCLPYYDPRRAKNISIPVPGEEKSFGCGFWVPDGSSAKAYCASCAACRMFGSLKFGGRFSIGDALPQEKHAPALESRNGVAIDRFTGGTVRGALFDMQVLVGGQFQAQLRLTNFELWQLAALNFLLQDLEDEMLTIGSGRSRGLGRIRGQIESYHLSYVKAVDYLAGLYQLASTQERQEYGLHDWKPDEAITLPQPTIRGLRHLYKLEVESWSQPLQALQPALSQFLQGHGGPKTKAAEVA